MRKLVLLVIALGLAVIYLAFPSLSESADGANSETFYVYTDEQGKFFFTDDLKQVPKRYRDRVETRTWEQLREATDDKWTPHSSPVPSLSEIPADPPTTPECGEPLTTARKWVAIGGFIREQTVTYDSCGNLLDSVISDPEFPVDSAGGPSSEVPQP